MDHRTYLKIDLNKLEHNYNSVRNKLPSGIKLLGVIKANAYGNGAVEIGKFLDDKCDFFGVVKISRIYFPYSTRYLGFTPRSSIFSKGIG